MASRIGNIKNDDKIMHEVSPEKNLRSINMSINKFIIIIAIFIFLLISKNPQLARILGN